MEDCKTFDKVQSKPELRLKIGTCSVCGVGKIHIYKQGISVKVVHNPLGHP